MDKETFIKICSIKKIKEEWLFYDCDGKELRQPVKSPVFPSSMNRRYRFKRRDIIGTEDTSCVWVLIGNNSFSKWIQVGRTKSLTNMLSSDIKEDIKEFYSGKGRYGKLKEKYNELIFYEINVEKYIQSDKEAQNVLGKMPVDENLRQVYLVNCAAYIEGKLAYQEQAELYHPSTLDGYFYAFFKGKK